MKLENKTQASMYDNLFFESESFNFELIRILGLASYKGADFGECVITASRIKDNDRRSWTDEWRKTADELLTRAEKFDAENDVVSAEYCFYCASN